MTPISALALFAALATGAAEARLPDTSLQVDSEGGLLPRLHMVSSHTSKVTYQFSIKAGPLGPALVAFAEQTGFQISSKSDVVANHFTDGVSGEMTAAEALRALISNTGLSSNQVGARGFSVNLPPRRTAQATELPGIVITGELIERDVQDTQTSVAVITGEELEQRADPDIFSVFERTAGVSLGFNSEQIAIRGIRQSGISGGGDPVITTRIDGAITNFGRFSFNALKSTWDLEQVEVLRGPQSTQQGRNALAGAVEIRSKDPTYEQEVKVRGEIGNGGTFGGAFAINAPIVKDAVAVRVSVDRKHTDGFVDNITLGIDDQDKADNTNIRVGLRVDPTDKLNVIFKYTHMNGKSSANGPVVQGSSFPDRRVTTANIVSTEDVKYFHAGNLRVTYDFNDAFSSKSESTYSKSNTFTLLDFDETAADGGVFSNDQDVESFEQEVKLLYKSDWLKAVFGGFFSRDITASPQVATVPGSVLNALFPPGVIIDGSSQPGRKTTNYAAFGEAEVRIIPRLKLIAGGRYDYQKVENSIATETSVNNQAFAAFLPPSSNFTREASFKVFLPKLGIVHDFTDDVSLGFTVQRGYRAGGVSIDRVTGAFAEFDPEFTWNYEVAFRSQWWDKRLTLNANAFYTEWRDQQVFNRDPASPFLGLTENAGESRLFGGEVDIKLRPTDNLDLFASFGYADTEFLDFGDDTGNEFPNAAKYTLAFGASYRFYGGAFVGADASYQSSSFGDTANTAALKLDGRFLVNARIGYGAENWKITAYANNLLDEAYVTNVQNATLGQQGPVTVGAPRT
ncbi:MAG: TonB-dependent receptor, partial [Pseudomonadota bacterium]